jgi:hypothetical protein
MNISGVQVSGIRVVKEERYTVCHIDRFTEDLQGIIRQQLSSVCHGPSNASLDMKLYSYRNTLREFLRRYESKSSTTKMGMIGELLTHMLIIMYFPEFSTVSPYFNLEERSIKKGFDVILRSNIHEELWITEVKSGELHSGKTANETNKNLITLAKRDLNRRLNEREATLWFNAINGAKIALESNTDVKAAVVGLLSKIAGDVTENIARSSDKSVILVASLFASLSDEIQEQEVKNLSKTVNEDKAFKDVIVFSLQKETFHKVADFLREEAEQ